MNINVIYAGTPEFAVPPLAALIANGFKPLAVYTQPDRPVGRGLKTTRSPVKQLAESHAIPVFTPTSLRDPEVHHQWLSMHPDLVIVVAYGQIVPLSLLQLPRLGCVNLHASLLPRWRGAAPIQRAIMANDHTTGVCLMQMAEGLDTGDVLAGDTIAIDPNETALALTDRLSQVAANLLVKSLPHLADLIPTPQSNEGISYAHKITRADAAIDWSKSALSIHNQIRGLKPWPVAETTAFGEELKIHASELLSQSTDPGSDTTPEVGCIVAVSAQGMDVACGQGILRLTHVQRPGRSVVTTVAYLNGLRNISPVGQLVGGDRRPSP